MLNMLHGADYGEMNKSHLNILLGWLHMLFDTSRKKIIFRVD